MAPSATARIPGPDGLGPGERTALAKPWHARPTPRFVWWTSVWVATCRLPGALWRMAFNCGRAGTANMVEGPAAGISGTG